MATNEERGGAVNNSRPWNIEDAEMALALENEYQRNSLLIRFPDLELSEEIVRTLHPSIESVSFWAPNEARFCSVQLIDGANVDQVISDIEENIEFGVGKLKAERKLEDPVTAEDIDPETLFVENLPANISTQVLKEKFPTAVKIDLGRAPRERLTRCSFIKFRSAEAAMEAYKSAVNVRIDSRSIIFRFRRHKRPVGPPGEFQAEHLIAREPVRFQARDGARLYVGNLPANISTQVLKEIFPAAVKIDLGYARGSLTRRTRYSFIRFKSVEAAMEANRSAVNVQIDSRPIICRFLRQRRAGPPGGC